MVSSITEKSAAERSAALHLSDIDFRGETIYFIVLDRFYQGNPRPRGERQDLNDPTRTDWGKYWGGDLQGVLDKLDYLQGMGVTAIWMTPLFEQVEALVGGLAATHGYWARDFKRINERWVNSPEEVRIFSQTETIFDKLLAEMHRRGMKFILDIVCNHSSPVTDEGKGKLYDDGVMIADFDNDTRSWYHHYGGVTDWNDDWQVKNCDLAGLATFNENNQEYRDYIKSSIKLWLDRGVDALRIDTVKHMPLWFWQEFTSDMLTHKSSVFIFGEWIDSGPDIAPSVEFANHSGMTILDFGFCQAIRNCLGDQVEKGWYVVDHVLSKDHLYKAANEMVTFYENHDMPRLQSLGADQDQLRLATVLLLTSRGIPCLYYGAEQYLHDDTDGGKDPYNRPMMQEWDTTTEIYRLTSLLSAERVKNPALQFGRHIPLYVTPDVYVFLRKYHDSFCLVLLNRGGAIELTLIDTCLPDGEYRCLLTGRFLTLHDGCTDSFQLDGLEAWVFSKPAKKIAGKSLVRLQANGIETKPGETLVVVGDCPELGNWDVTQAAHLEYINENTWFGEIPFAESAGKTIAYKLVVMPKEGAPRRENRTTRRRPIAQSGITKWRDVWEE